MRPLFAVLSACESEGIRLKANGTGLEVRGSSTPELREELSYHKLNLLTYLRTGHCHHELKPEKCKVCNGKVRKLIEEAS